MSSSRNNCMVLLSTLLLAAGCAREPQSKLGPIDVTVMPDTEADAAHAYLASAATEPGRTFSDYFGAFGKAAFATCKGYPYMFGESRLLSSGDMGAKVPQDFKPQLKFSCSQVSLPNLRTLESGAFDAAVRGSVDSNGFWTTPSDASKGAKLRAFNELIGNHVREAYASRCGGQSLTIDKIEMLEEDLSDLITPDETRAHPKDNPGRVGVNLSSHCKQAPGTSGTEAALPAGADL